MYIRTSTGKKTGAALFAALLAGAISVNAGAADTAVIVITGTVVSNTCTLSDSSRHQTKVLPPIADRDIRGRGTTGASVSFDIDLEDCGPGTTGVRVTASGTPDGSETDAFGNTLADGAKGVALYVYRTNGTDRFKPDGSVSEVSPLTPSTSNRLTYRAAYVGTGEAVTAGRFSTVVNMKFEYQ